MADRIYNIKIDTDAKQSLQSVTGLKTELQRLEAEFETVGVGSAEFNKLGDAIKGIRTQLKDIDLQFEGLDKEQRATALVDTFNGLTGAIGAVSSAFIAFGVESEAIDNAEKKLLGVIGVVSGLRDVSNSLVSVNKLLGSSLRDAFTTATGAINGTRVALTGLGIGAVIGLVVLLSDAFEDVSDATKKANEEQKKYNDELKDLALEREKLQKGEEQFTRDELKRVSDRLKAGQNELTELTEGRKKRLRDLKVLGLEEVKSEKKRAEDKIKNRAIENQRLLNAQIELQNKVNAFDEKAKTDEKNRATKQSADLLKITTDRLNKEEKAISDYNQALRDLGEKQITDADELITVQFENRISALKQAETRELAQENLTEAAKLAIVEKYNALRQIADIEATQKREALAKAALDKQVALTIEASNKITAATELEINELTTFYDDVLAQFQKVNVDVLKQIFETSDPREFFNQTVDDIKAKYQELINAENELAISSEKNIKESERRKLEAIRKTALDQIVLIENAQKAQISEFEEQLKNDKLTVEQRQKLEDQLEAVIQQGQIRKKQITEKAAQDEVEITNRTAEQIEQRRLALNQFLITSVASLFSSLRTLNQVADDADEADKKRAFERDKQFATAEAIITGLLAVQRVFSNAAANPKSILFPAQPYIEAALAGVATIARVRQIQSATFNSTGVNTAGGTGSTGTVSGNNANILNPFAGQGAGGQNILPQRVAPPTTGGTQGQSAFGGPELAFAGGQAPVVRAYVLAGDVTDAQTADFKLKNKRTL